MVQTKFSTEEQVQALIDSDDGGPIAIANLLKFKEKAQYPAGAAEAPLGLSGREAYQLYADAFLELIADFGARSLYWGDTIAYAIGEGEWDAVWVNHFPSFDALRAASTDPRYADMHRHRDAGLAYQHAIATRPTIAAG